MVTKSSVASDEFSEDGWEDVPTDVQVKFDTDGDTLTGKFLGWSETDNGIVQAHFQTEEHGDVFVNCGWDLKRQLKGIKAGTMTRIIRIGTRDTGQQTPMVEFKVQTKR